MSKESLKGFKPTTICRPDRIFTMGAVWLHIPPTGCQGLTSASGQATWKINLKEHVHWAFWMLNARCTWQHFLAMRATLTYLGLPNCWPLLWGQVHQKSALIQTHNLLNTPQAFLPFELLGFSNLTPFLRALTFRCGDFKQDSCEALRLQCWAHMASSVLSGIHRSNSVCRSVDSQLKVRWRLKRVKRGFGVTMLKWELRDSFCANLFKQDIYQFLNYFRLFLQRCHKTAFSFRNAEGLVSVNGQNVSTWPSHYQCTYCGGVPRICFPCVTLD